MSVASRSRPPWPLLLLALLLVAFLAAPLLTLIGELPRSDHTVFTRDETLSALRTTLVAATAATAIDALGGIPLGLWLARSRSRVRHLVTAAVVVPLAVPPVVGGVVLVLWLGPDGWMGRWLDRAGLDPLGTLAGTVLAQMFVAAPFVVIAARAAFSGVDPAIEEAARALGCGPVQTLLRVLLPAARRGIAAGIVLGWLRCFGEFGATALVAYHPYTLPVLTYVKLTGEGLDQALPIAALAAGAGALGAAVILWLDAGGGRREPAPATPQPVPRAPVALAWMGASPAARMASAGAPRRLAANLELRLHGFELAVALDAPSESLAILGPSGAGKSLTLRAVAGLVAPDRGRVVLDGRVLLDTAARIDQSPQQRGLGYVGQQDALFEHLDVDANISFGIRGVSRTLQRRRIDELVTAMGLQAVRHSRPATLSGGEKRRVALARALAASPSALLLDEPFSGVDASVRAELRRLVRGVRERTGLPTVLVTHDRDDVLELAGDVVVLERGRVVQAGPVEEIVSRPATASVARLVGMANVLPVAAVRSSDGTVIAATALGDVALGAVAVAPDGSRSLALAIPSDAVEVEIGSGARVVAVRPAPGGWRVELQSDTGARLEALVLRALKPSPPALGARCAIRLDAARCRLVPG